MSNQTLILIAFIGALLFVLSFILYMVEKHKRKQLQNEYEPYQPDTLIKAIMLTSGDVEMSDGTILSADFRRDFAEGLNFVWRMVYGIWEKYVPLVYHPMYGWIIGNRDSRGINRLFGPDEILVQKPGEMVFGYVVKLNDEEHIFHICEIDEFHIAEHDRLKEEEERKAERDFLNEKFEEAAKPEEYKDESEASDDKREP